jgi:hypothetical protein
LTKPTTNPAKGLFVSGRPGNEIRRHAAVLGSLPCPARRHSERGGQELPLVAAESEPSLASFSPPEGQRRTLHDSSWLAAFASCVLKTYEVVGDRGVWRALERLSPEARRQAQRAYRTFQTTPSIPRCISRKWTKNAMFGR